MKKQLRLLLGLSLWANIAFSQGFPELMYFKFDTIISGKTFNEATSITRAGVDSASVLGLTIGGVGQFNACLNGLAGATASNRVNPAWTGTHTGSWTISFWCNPPTPATTRYYFGNSSGNGTFRCFIGGAASGIRLTGGVPSITLDMPAFTPGVGNVITYVYDQTAGTVSGYINGVFQTSASPGTSYPLVGANFIVGSQGTSIEGKMDEFRMYNRALSATEVASAAAVELFNIPCTGTPVAGTAVSSKTYTCSASPFNLGLTGTTAGSGLAFQWQTSIDSIGPYSNLLNDTSAVIIKTQTSSNWYRCIVSCSGLADISSVVYVYTPTNPLSGAYTLNTANPISSTNYHSLSDFVTEISCVGITGPVTMDIAPGTPPFSGQLNFGAITGASNINTVTLNGHGATITGAISPMVSFSGTQYVTLDSFNLIADPGYAGFGIHIGNQSQYLTLTHNTIDVGQTATASSSAGIVVSGSSATYNTAGNNAQNLTITHNEIIGGYTGMTLIGNSSYLDNTGHLIQDNIFRDYYVYGLYIANGDSIQVLHNDFHRKNRATLSTFYGIFQSSCRNMKIVSNSIHDAGTGSYTAYPLYLSTSVNAAGFETEFINNSIFNINSSGTIYGMYLLGTRDGVNLYNNTIILDNGAGTTRALWMSTAPTNHTIKNNIFSVSGSGAGTKYCIYVSIIAASMVSNNNVFHMGATAGTNYVGYYAANQATLANWQATTSQDSLSVNLDPVFAHPASGNILPLSSGIDNIGTPIPSVTVDQSGAARSATTPDVGAFEFTGIPGDLLLEKGELFFESQCYSTTDTVSITIKNIIGTTADFSINPLTIHWKVTGPVITVDSFVVNSGTLDFDSSQTFTAYNVNMSQAGEYTLDAYITPNTVNASALNDTLLSQQFKVKSILEVSPKTITVNSPTDTVVLTAKSTLFPGGGPFFSEIAHYKTTTGQPTAGWPTYLLADDYVELTGVANSDLAGVVYEEWSASALTYTVTFPTGTLFGPNGTLILATGQLGSSVAVPASFYYHTGNTVTHSSTTSGGYVLKDGSGNVIDAVGYGGFTFPAASGVTAADWSGTTTAANSGIRLTAPDNNTSINWVNSSTSPQDPNDLNAGVTAPLPGILTGFDWNYLGSSFATSPKVTVGPYTTPGVYAYVASYSNACGIFYDTAYVTASATVPVKLVSFSAVKANADVNLNWNTASEVNNNHFEIEKSVDGRTFKAIGRVKGNGTTSKTSRYVFADKDAVTKTTAKSLYYRLKQVDNDGTFTYSKTEVVRLSENRITDVSTRPNPSNGEFTVLANLMSAQPVNMSVINMMGTTVWKQTVTPTLGENAFDTQLTLPNGIYMLLMEQNGESTSHKIVIVK
jgi:hypothetical protein